VAKLGLRVALEHVVLDLRIIIYHRPRENGTCYDHDF
jgi:hypothetical protein